MTIVGLLIHAILIGCGSNHLEGSSETAPTDIAPEYSSFLGSTEFSVGDNRVSFTLRSRDGEPLEGARVIAQIRHADDTAHSPPELTATYHEIQTETPHEHSDGHSHPHVYRQGIYVLDQVPIDRAGIWLAEFTVVSGGALVPKIEGLAFSVSEESSVPIVGTHLSEIPGGLETKGVRIPSPTLDSAAAVLGNESIGGAMGKEAPVLVVFASPEFCTSAMCGPVTQVAGLVAKRLNSNIGVFRVEPYDLDSARKDGTLRMSLQVQNWELPTEPWTFVISSDGVIVARFEGLYGADELATAITRALDS